MDLKFWGSDKGPPTETQFVLGADRRIVKKALESTGAFFLNSDDLLAYVQIDNGMRRHIVRKKSGAVEYLGQVGLLFELSAHPWNFDSVAWENSIGSDDVIISNALHMGIATAEQEAEKAKTYEGMRWAIIMVSSIIGMILLIYCIANFDQISGSLNL